MCFLVCVPFKRRHAVPLLICVSGRAGSSSVWVRAGVRTQREGKGPANAEWQLIMPHRYISIYPSAGSVLTSASPTPSSLWSGSAKTHAAATILLQNGPLHENSSNGGYEAPGAIVPNYNFSRCVNISAYEHTHTRAHTLKAWLPLLFKPLDSRISRASTTGMFIFMPLTGFKLPWFLPRYQTWIRFCWSVHIFPSHQIRRIRDLTFTSAERDTLKQVTHNLLIGLASSDSEFSC